MRAFISYSHKDKDHLDRLHVHLKSLTRGGKLTTWFDREIFAGAELDQDIKRELESADLFLLLISPDFIASDYCMNTELSRAIERHDDGSAIVVPIIIEPCDWISVDSLRKLKALPLDGKPVTDWTNSNTAFLNIIQEIRRLTERFSPSLQSKDGGSPAAATTITTQSRYRVKKSFDEIDQQDFRDECFVKIKAYFKQAVSEINEIDGLKSRFIDNGEASFSAILVNQEQSNASANMTVRVQTGRHGFGDISYSYDLDATSNTSNGWFQVKFDEYMQYLDGHRGFFGEGEERLTPEAAAKLLWTDFIGQAGVTHA